MLLQIRQDLLDEGIEFIQSCESSSFYSAREIAQSRFISCDDSGIVTIELPNGELTVVDSMDLEYINE
jgi:hypothetical protein